MFKKTSNFGFNTRVVELRLYADLKTLVYDDITNKSKPTEILLNQIRKLNIPNLTSIEIKTNEKSYEFEADTASTAKKWVDALKLAIEKAHQPTLKEIIHRNRRELIENKYKLEDIENRKKLHETTKANRIAKRQEIKGRYGNSS